MRKLNPWVAAGLIMCMFAWVGCDDDDDITTVPDMQATTAATTTGLAGTVMHPDGVTPVGLALVTATMGASVGKAGNVLTTYTAADGTWALAQATSGTYTVTAVKGAFQATVTLTAGSGVVTAVLQVTVPASAIGVVPGSYDDIGAILTSLGYSFTTLSVSDLSDATKLANLSRTRESG